MELIEDIKWRAGGVKRGIGSMASGQSDLGSPICAIYTGNECRKEGKGTSPTEKRGGDKRIAEGEKNLQR